mmetsp:Transcript_12537/g.24080  ORF Transcript_12537/g.24080 Transcript_12537/m.24080 type:complete len:261 (+) Transcript_12537:99-881(+)
MPANGGATNLIVPPRDDLEDEIAEMYRDSGDTNSLNRFSKTPTNASGSKFGFDSDSTGKKKHVGFTESVRLADRSSDGSVRRDSAKITEAFQARFNMAIQQMHSHPDSEAGLSKLPEKSSARKSSFYQNINQRLNFSDFVFLLAPKVRKVEGRVEHEPERVPKQKITAPDPRSLYIFSLKNPVRKACTISKHKFFEHFFTVVILTNCVFLALDTNPARDSTLGCGVFPNNSVSAASVPDASSGPRSDPTHSLVATHLSSS